MKASLSYTSFRHLIQLLSIYSEKSRSDDVAFKTKWEIGGGIQIFGYQSPYRQTRLSIIRLDDSHLDDVNSDSHGFATEVPTTRGLATATSRDDLTIMTEPEHNYVAIRTDDFSYHITKGSTQPDMSLEEQFLPMKQLKLRGSVESARLQKLVKPARGGPLQLEVTDETVRFVSSTPNLEASFDITDATTVLSDIVNLQYKYDLDLISKPIKKLPSNKEVEIYVNEDLIRLRCKLSDGIELNHYQRGY